jgi:ABC-2 type transport system ATP-binding protein
MRSRIPEGEVLRLVGVGKRYRNATALRDLSLALEPGELYGLVGPDGAGKTTCLRIAAGLLRAGAGRVRALGFDIPGQERRARAFIGYMPQQYSLYGDLSVQENLRFFAGMYGVQGAELREREARLLGMARLQEFRDRPAQALSGGMYKKLALCCVLMHRPRLLLLDEPTNGVDPISRRELWAFLEELVAESVAVLVSTAYMDEAERCARVGLLVEGRLIAEGSPAEMKSDFGQVVYELLTEGEPLEATVLAEQPGVAQVYRVGRALHIVTGMKEGFREQIESWLDARAVAVTRLQVVEPSFEDIFFAESARSAAAEARPAGGTASGRG